MRDVKSLKTFISNVELVEHVTRVTHTHTQGLHLSSQDNDLFSWTVYTLTHSKPKPQD